MTPIRYGFCSPFCWRAGEVTNSVSSCTATARAAPSTRNRMPRCTKWLELLVGGRIKHPHAI